MRLDRLTNKFQLALADAQSLALGHDNQFIEPLHLMSALLNQEGGSVSPLLTSAGINAGQLRTDINQALNRLPQVEGTGGDVQPSQDLVRVLNLCDKLAQKRGDNFISSELFVLAALESRGTLADIRQRCRDAKVVSQAMVIASPNLGARHWPTLTKSKLYDASFTHRFRKASVPVTPTETS